MMKQDSILDKVREIKAQLAEESGHDMRQFVKDLRDWGAQNPHKGLVVKNREELEGLLEKNRHGEK